MVAMRNKFKVQSAKCKMAGVRKFCIYHSSFSISRHRGFSLIELLVVISILALLMAVAFPAIQSSIAGSRLTTAGQMLADQLNLARQEAVTRNRDVQVRLIWLAPDAKGGGALQLYSADPKNLSALQPIGKMTLLPDRVVISPQKKLSPLLTNPATAQATADFPGRGALSYYAIRFRPDGGTNLAFNSPENYLTLTAEAEAGQTPPANYVAIQVDPANGRTRLYRP